MRLENFVCSVGENLRTIHVINCFREKLAKKLETKHPIFQHVLWKKSLDYNEKSLDQPKIIRRGTSDICFQQSHVAKRLIL